MYYICIIDRIINTCINALPTPLAYPSWKSNDPFHAPPRMFQCNQMSLEWQVTNLQHWQNLVKISTLLQSHPVMKLISIPLYNWPLNLTPTLNLTFHAPPSIASFSANQCYSSAHIRTSHVFTSSRINRIVVSVIWARPAIKKLGISVLLTLECGLYCDLPCWNLFAELNTYMYPLMCTPAI